MDNIDTIFCRHLLSAVHADVKKARPAINLRKAAWVYGPMFRDCWEFHGPNDFYWYGEAANAYDARAKGWSKWLRKEGVAGYTLED